VVARLFVRSEAKDNICLRTMKKNRSRDYLRFSVRTRDRYPINIDCDFDYWSRPSSFLERVYYLLL